MYPIPNNMQVNTNYAYSNSNPTGAGTSSGGLLQNQQSTPHYGGILKGVQGLPGAEIKRLEERIAASARDSENEIKLTTSKLDLSLEALKGSISDLKSEIRDARSELRGEISSFRSDTLTNLRWIIGLGASSLIAVIAKAMMHS